MAPRTAASRSPSKRSEVDDGLRIGIGDERMAFFGEPFTQRQVVLDDAVVHHDDPALGVAVRVGVLFVGHAVGRPAGVTDAERTGQRFAVQHALEILQLTGGAPYLERTVRVHHGDAGRVVAAVLE